MSSTGLAALATLYRAAGAAFARGVAPEASRVAPGGLGCCHRDGRHPHRVPHEERGGTRAPTPDPVAHVPGFSFPSGHAMTAMVSCAVFLLVLLPLVPPVWRPLLWALAVTSVLGVGYTRVALGVHGVSDVVGGWLLGLLAVTATTFASEAWRADIGRRRTTVGEGLEPEGSGTEPEPPIGTSGRPGPTDGPTA